MDGGTKEARDALKASGAIATVQWVKKDEQDDPALKTSMPTGGLDEEHCQAIFRKFDVNGTGSIDLRELQELTRSLGLFLTSEDISNAMIDLDKDGSGDIDFGEFWGWWQEVVLKINMRSPVGKRQTPQNNKEETNMAPRTPQSNFGTDSPGAGQNLFRSRSTEYAKRHNYSYQTANPLTVGYNLGSPLGSPSPTTRPGSPAVGGWLANGSDGSETRASKARPSSAASVRPSSAASSRSRPGSTTPYYGKVRNPLGGCYVVPERVEYNPANNGRQSVPRPSSAPGWRIPTGYTREFGVRRVPDNEQTGFRI